MKRGSSGLSCLIGVNKEINMSSHDVVNRCRKIFSEKRVGHAGTLDPGATGVLLICVGPATRLNPYLSTQEKTYRFKVCFGSATDTDDAQGRVIEEKPVASKLYDYAFAREQVAQLVGKTQQMPPAYSAIKVDGKRSYEAARKGESLALTLREIDVFEASLLSLELDSQNRLIWEIVVRVSKGTYIRSLARDLGESLNTCAHVVELERQASGSLRIDQCLRLDALEQSPKETILDPVSLLGFRCVRPLDSQIVRIKNGSVLEADSAFFCEPESRDGSGLDSVSSAAILLIDCGMKHDELISIATDEELLALYKYNAHTHRLHPQCVFSTGVLRGFNF